MGAGPLRLLADDRVPAELSAAGLEAAVAWLDEPSEPEHETGRTFELDRQVSRRVAEAMGHDRLPVLVAGNCIVSLGAIAGIAGGTVGILWLDAHPDFHTPETTPTGFLDGTGLAAATGACWHALCSTIPGFAPVAEDHVVLAGVRDIDPGESERLEASSVMVVAGGAGPGRFAADELKRAMAGIATGIDALYLHIDLDVIDPGFGIANAYATPGGLSPDEVLSAAIAAGGQVPVRAVSFTAYDPSYDGDGRFADTATDLIVAVLTALGSSSRS
jgi:arginase